MTLVETGTRALIGAVFGPLAGEAGEARRLLHLLRPDMLVLADRGFDATAFLAEVAGMGAQFLVRLNAARRPPVIARLDDGTFLSRIGALPVRIIPAHVTVTCADGTTWTGSYRLATTLADHRRHPAAELIRLYHERWEHEVAYLALRHTLLAGRVLRSGDPAGLQQEVWALLALYQALRRAMVTAVETVPGTDPDRASFTIALELPPDPDPGRRRDHRHRRPHRTHRPGRPEQPAATTPSPGQRPEDQVPAITLEQSRPAPPLPQHPGHHDHHHSHRTRHSTPGRDTPSPVLDPHTRPLTPRHCV